jgi:hypothetical protein
MDAAIMALSAAIAGAAPMAICTAADKRAVAFGARVSEIHGYKSRLQITAAKHRRSIRGPGAAPFAIRRRLAAQSHFFRSALAAMALSEEASTA